MVDRGPPRGANLAAFWGEPLPPGPAGAAGGRPQNLRGASGDPPRLRVGVGGHAASMRALAFTPDSRRLCSGGLDKDVHVWSLDEAARNLRRSVRSERTIRWQVARGPRGNIYALAAAPSDGLLALGGYGAMGSLGEILLVEPVSGRLAGVLNRHRQSIASLAFSRDGQSLLSVSVEGEAILWQRPQWQPAVVAAETGSASPFWPAAIAGDKLLVLATRSEAPAQENTWRLTMIRSDDFQKRTSLPEVHAGAVTAIAATSDGRFWASADLQGRLYLWEVAPGQETSPKAHLLAQDKIVLSLAFAPDSGTLLAGTAVAGAQGSEVQFWDVAARKLTRTRKLVDHVTACAISPDGKQAAYVGGENHEVFVESLPAGARGVELRGRGRRILKVAFAASEPYHRIAFGSRYREARFNDYADLEQSFDLDKVELSEGVPDPRAFLPLGGSPGGWSIQPEAARLVLSLGGRLRGSIDTAGMGWGNPRCYCWIQGADGRPRAIAVGTDGENGVYVFRLDEGGRFPLLRWFRGQSDYVASVAVSADGRHLASASGDGTVQLWSLHGYEQGETVLGRWGAECVVADGALRVTAVDHAGPLFRRGVRLGDVIAEIRWQDGQEIRIEKTPEAIRETLRSLPWNTQVVFQAGRDGAARDPFQILPAWQPLATLFVSVDRHWAYWTPEGYYDASVEGDRLFGWQVNRGLERLPDFFRADQFRRTLERPDVMERLLRAGSLEDAFQQAGNPPARPLGDSLPAQIAVAPRLEILSPQPGDRTGESPLTVKARVELPPGADLTRVLVHANGVPGGQQQLVAERAVAGARELTYSWRVPLPAEQRNLIQLAVDTSTKVRALGEVIVERADPLPPRSDPKLYVLAVGINRYSDEEIPSLSWAVADATAVSDMFRRASPALYGLGQAALLTDRDATADSWRDRFAAVVATMGRTVKPDDLLVVFMAGHGIQDQRDQQYYYLGCDASQAEIDRGDYTRCIRWDDFQSLAGLACRKLVILDTCHSGAIRPLRDRQLKAGLRALEDSIVFTIAASAGHELAAEKKEWGHGVFTMSLLDALLGRADRDDSGLVTLDELVEYVQRKVPEITGDRQHPSASPSDLLSYTSLPLTEAQETREVSGEEK